MNNFHLYIYHFLTLLMLVTRMLPVKRIYLRWVEVKGDDNVHIVSSAIFYLTGKFEIKNNTWIGYEILIVGEDTAVFIGRSFDIVPRVNIITGTHKPFTMPGKVAKEGYSSRSRLNMVRGSGLARWAANLLPACK